MKQHNSPPVDRRNPLWAAAGSVLNAGRATLPVRQLTVCLAAVAVLAISGPQARAAFVLVFDKAAYTENVGGTVTVAVSLQDTTKSGTQIEDFGVRVSFNNPNSSITRVVSPNDITLNPSIDATTGGPIVTKQLGPTNPAADSPTNTFAELLLFHPKGGGTPSLFDASGFLLLGTFKFTGLTVGTVTITAATSPNQAFTDSLGNTLTVSSGTATIQDLPAATPEPGSLALIGCATGLMAGAGWWRRRRQAAAKVSPIES